MKLDLMNMVMLEQQARQQNNYLKSMRQMRQEDERSRQKFLKDFGQMLDESGLRKVDRQPETIDNYANAKNRPDDYSLDFTDSELANLENESKQQQEYMELEDQEFYVYIPQIIDLSKRSSSRWSYSDDWFRNTDPEPDMPLITINDSDVYTGKITVDVILTAAKRIISPQVQRVIEIDDYRQADLQSQLKKDKMQGIHRPKNWIVE